MADRQDFILGDPIPFEKQQTSGRNRMCGAAVLCMVYRSYGQQVTQDEIWEQISQPWLRNTHCAATHKMAADALQRGLAAVIVQTREPWQTLERSLRTRLRLILNHRTSSSSRSGHYSVVVQLSDHDITLHDPQEGPLQLYDRPEFLQLWSTLRQGSEIAGNVLIACGLPDEAAFSCPECARELPPTRNCSRCRKEFPLRPAAALGCLEDGCSQRTWSKIYCPHCDSPHW